MSFTILISCNNLVNTTKQNTIKLDSARIVDSIIIADSNWHPCRMPDNGIEDEGAKIDTIVGIVPTGKYIIISTTDTFYIFLKENVMYNLKRGSKIVVFPMDNGHLAMKYHHLSK